LTTELGLESMCGWWSQIKYGCFLFWFLIIIIIITTYNYYYMLLYVIFTIMLDDGPAMSIYQGECHQPETPWNVGQLVGTGSWWVVTC
jgi:hypothetical protein